MAARLYGLLAEFASAADLVAAARQAHDAGFRRLDAFAPYPVDGLAETIDPRRSRIPAVMLAGGLAGAAAAYAMQYFALAVDYPLNVGGRPLHSWPAFIPITFALSVLSATLCGVAAMLWRNGLPRLHHPLFAIDRFERSSIDAFFLCLEAADKRFGPETVSLLESAGAVKIWEVPS